MLCHWGNPKGSRIPARGDFDGIYPTAPVFMPKTRKGGKEMPGGTGSWQRQAPAGEGASGGECAACQGVGRRHTPPPPP